jgi:hypothetical protein
MNIEALPDLCQEPLTKLAEKGDCWQPEWADRIKAARSFDRIPSFRRTGRK